MRHGEDDQFVPIADAALKAIELLRNGTLKIYPGFSHGMPTVNADLLNADLPAFVQGRAVSGAGERGVREGALSVPSRRGSR